MFDFKIASERQKNLLRLVKSVSDNPNAKKLLLLIRFQTHLLARLRQIEPSESKYKQLMQSFLDCYSLQQEVLELVLQTSFAEVPNHESLLRTLLPNLDPNRMLQVALERQNNLLRLLKSCAVHLDTKNLLSLTHFQTQLLVYLEQIKPSSPKYNPLMHAFLECYSFQQQELELILQTSFFAQIPYAECLRQVMLPHLNQEGELDPVCNDIHLPMNNEYGKQVNLSNSEDHSDATIALDLMVSPFQQQDGLKKIEVVDCVNEILDQYLAFDYSEQRDALTLQNASPFTSINNRLKETGPDSESPLTPSLSPPITSPASPIPRTDFFYNPNSLGKRKRNETTTEPQVSICGWSK